MIQKIGDYYTIDQQKPRQKVNNNDSSNIISRDSHLKETGSLKQKINAIRQRFADIKIAKEVKQQKGGRRQARSILEMIKVEKQAKKQQLDIQLLIPQQILKLDQRLCVIEEKLNSNQLMRRKIEQKGVLVERIKQLQEKLQKMVQKSSQIIIQNIQTYCSSLQDKEQYLKILFLKQAYNKTKGMKEQMEVLQTYLKNLNHIQTNLKALQPKENTLKSHNQILNIRNSLKNKVKALFTQITQDYHNLQTQIDAISI